MSGRGIPTARVRPTIRWWIAIGLTVLAAGAAGCTDDTATRDDAMDPVQMLAGSGDEGFQRATEPRPFVFPDDHGPHPGFRTEWWYVTGNVRDAEGAPYGFQFTVFRSALSAVPPDTDSPWSTNQFYMAHLAVTDSARGTHRSFERFARGAVGLAGAEAEPFRVWLEDWELSGAVSGSPLSDSLPSRPGGILPVQLHAVDADLELDLRLGSGKPLVLHGDKGLSAKSGDPGNASFYYSFTRLPVSGNLRLGERTLDVSGAAWMDREWSTSVLSPDQTGWDWWSLQLEDGRDLMLFRLRGRDGGGETVDGTLVEPDGRSRRLRLEDTGLEEGRLWRSGDGQAEYPVEWRLTIPGEGLDLLITPLLDDQEVRHAFRYWEGAVRVTSADPRASVAGVGYLEMTGYGVTPPVQ